MVRASSRSAPLLAILAALLYGSLLAAVPAQAQSEPGWLESYNRAMHSFNTTVDRNVLKPVARGYKKVTPDFVDRGVTNFFSNINDVVVVANDLMQFKFAQAARDTHRFVMNTTFGVFGLIDVATPMGVPKNHEDFGQTLGYWGVGEGYYVVLPLLGPTTTRDVFRLPVDGYISPLFQLDPGPVQVGLWALDVVDIRADLLQAEAALSGAALDPYTFQREAYLQRRRAMVRDGAEADPADTGEDDLFDELDQDYGSPDAMTEDELFEELDRAEAEDADSP